MPKISVVIITANEEKNIERCLLSVKDVADEILVVDSFSTDRTQEICLKYNARFIQHAFEGYIEQKNWAASQAQYDYVLSLDADEALSEELKTSILKVKEIWNADGYTFSRLNNYCGKWIRHTSWYPSRKLRLWDRRKGKWDGLNPHDKFEMEKGAIIKRLKGDLLHYPYNNINEHIQQINKFTDILSDAYLQKGIKSSIGHILFRPFWRFFRDYFIELGILDGLYGFVISINGSYEVYLKYLKLKVKIENEKKKAPHRICFLISDKHDKQNGNWILENIKNLEIRNNKSVFLINEHSQLIVESKIPKNKYINIPSKIFLLLFPVSLLKIVRIITQMRVRSIVVTNMFDARIAAICSLFTHRPNVFYYCSDDENIKSNFLNRFLFKNLIDKVFVKSSYVNITNNIVYSDKIEILHESNNLIIDKIHHTQELKVQVLLDKIVNPNCGLGRVAIDYSKALVTNNDCQVSFTYLLYGSNVFEHFNNQKTKLLKYVHRYLPAYFGKYDIIHITHQSPSFTIHGAVKTVLTIHDLNFLYTKNHQKASRYLKKVQKNVEKADAIVFISNFTRDICLQHLNIAPNKIVKVIYNGVELPDCIPQKPDFINNDEYLFTIGQFLSKKNFHVLLPFLKTLPENIKLVLAGENNTSYGAQVRKLVSNLDLDNRVILAGPISEAEKLYLYQHCKAFVFPSLYEGFGLPVIEAMRAKKPVFCSNKTSLKEIGDKYVYFWNSFEPQEMNAIYSAGIADYTEEKQAQAYEYSLKYTWKTNAQEYMQLFKSLNENV